MTLHTRPVPAAAAEVVRSLVAGSLDGDARDSAIDHLRACEACAALFDRLSEAERVATGGAAIGPLGLERVARRLGLEGATGRPPRVRARKAATLALAAGAAIIVLAMVIPVAREPEWIVRGDGGTSLRAPRLRAFRLVSRDGKTSAERLDPDSEGRLSVRRGDVLAFALTNPGDLRHARWSLTTPGATTPFDGPKSVPARVVEEPMDLELAVDLRFPRGRCELRVELSDSMNGPAIETAVLPLFVEVP